MPETIDHVTELRRVISIADSYHRPLHERSLAEIERLGGIEEAARNVRDNCRRSLRNPTVAQDERRFLQTVYVILSGALESRA